MRKKKSEAVSTESKAEKFRRLAVVRVNKTVKAMRQIANLANANSYEPQDGDVAKILDTLSGELQSIESRFSGVKASPVLFNLE